MYWLNKISQYFHNNLRAISQLFNAFTGGDEDEMVCGRVGKYSRDGSCVARQLEKILNFIFGDDHCLQCIEEDEGRNAL